MTINYCQGAVRIRAGRLWLATLAVCVMGMSALAQMPPAKSVPNFWDLQRRVEKPDTSFLQLIRFVTDDDYPPFGFTAPDGTLTGFNVELARAICRELEITCTVQRRRFDTIIEALENNQADAAVASIAITPKAREKLLFTHPYYRTPARFAARRNAGPGTIDLQKLSGQTVGVVAKTAHAAYLDRFFPQVKQKAYPDPVSLLQAIKSNDVSVIFGDGVTLAIWINGTDANDCCEFRGGAYTESFYFGEGVGIALNKNNPALQRVLDYALVRLAENGTYADLYLKYFPVGFY